ncbi:MAG: PLP-dependent transferase, partial [Deltaproteobacteria bacterium]|nr:PLP-dependent transferase [Deltaproteobacteria bacterium]
LNGRGSLAVASGMSAITLGLLGLLKAGDELIAGSTLFGGTYTLFTRTFPDMGITVHLVDPAHPEAAEEKFNANTKGVFLEAIANPAMVVPDFEAWGAACRNHEVPLLVDGTLLSPWLWDNSKIGAALAFFSASKYLAGPGTSIGGLVVDTGLYPWHEHKKLGLGDYKGHKGNALLAKLRRQMMADIGPTLSPFGAFLMITGMETLPLRMEKQCANAQQTAEALSRHPKVATVRYPGLPDDPFHQVAKRQFGGRYSSLMMFQLENKDQCFRFLNRLELIKRATNLGDTKTLALHPASTIYQGYWPHQLESVGISEATIRLSVGIEDPEDILYDLTQALDSL